MARLTALPRRPGLSQYPKYDSEEIPHPALHNAAQPSYLNGDGTLNAARVNVVYNGALVTPPSKHVYGNLPSNGNTTPVARSLTRGRPVQSVLPASPPRRALTARDASEVVHTSQEPFARGGPFVPATTLDDNTEVSRLHSVAGHALAVETGPMLSDIAVQLGVLPEGDPVLYPHPASGRPTVYLCSYLGAELTRLWVAHVPGLTFPVGERAHDVHRIIASAFRRMIALEHARRAADLRHGMQYALGKVDPVLAEKYHRADVAYGKNVASAAHSLTRATRDRIRASTYASRPPPTASYLYGPPQPQRYGSVPKNPARVNRGRKMPGEYTLGYTRLPTA